MKINTIGLEAPVGFPTELYNQVHALLSLSNYSEGHPDAWREWGGGWNAVAYRYIFCNEYSESYVNSIEKYGTSPKPLERYIQEKSLFGFFMSGFSAIDCFCYALYAIANIIDPTNFTLAADDDKKHITYSSTLAKFRKFFPNEKITVTLENIIGSSGFKDLLDIRTILAHRATPSRTFRLGGERDQQTSWGLEDLDEYTTVKRLQWLAEQLTLLLGATNDFTRLLPTVSQKE